MDQKERDEMLIRIDERVGDLAEDMKELQETTAKNRAKANSLENRVQRNETKLWLIGAGISTISAIAGAVTTAFATGFFA